MIRTTAGRGMSGNDASSMGAFIRPFIASFRPAIVFDVDVQGIILGFCATSVLFEIGNFLNILT